MRFYEVMAPQALTHAHPRCVDRIAEPVRSPSLRQIIRTDPFFAEEASLAAVNPVGRGRR
jgi:hypothetical protein